MNRTVFKALADGGKSAYQGWKWPLPVDRPGKWVEIDGDPVLCQSGFHGYHTREEAERQHPGCAIYEMEVDGTIVEDNDKLAASRARLFRLAPNEDRRIEELTSALEGLLEATEASAYNNGGAKLSMRERDAILVARMRLGRPGLCSQCGREHAA